LVYNSALDERKLYNLIQQSGSLRQSAHSRSMIPSPQLLPFMTSQSAVRGDSKTLRG